MTQTNADRAIRLVLLTVVMLAWTATGLTQDRFPRPEFETAYQLPRTTTPGPRALFYQILDAAALWIALGLASFFALKTRSRRALFILMILSVGYFGFFRKGCVCPVGSFQNVSLALADASYAIPLVVIVFFVTPLIFTLFFGRTFCAAVCPLGGVQDLFILKPLKLPPIVTQTLRLLPTVYLGLAVLFAATGSAFIVCRYDPFVSIFRFNGNFGIILLTGGFLLLSMFIARPYCQFLCPYGVLLGWLSNLSRRHVKITPDDCIECRLCEESCPFDAIRKPTTAKVPESRRQGIRRLGILLMILPIIIVFSGWTVSRLNLVLSRVHSRVRLAERIRLEDSGVFKNSTLETRTFRSSGTTTQTLFDDAVIIQKRYRTGGWLLGGFLGLVFMLRLIGLSVRRTRTDYEPDRTYCLSCGRCFKYCPREHARIAAPIQSQKEAENETAE